MAVVLKVIKINIIFYQDITFYKDVLYFYTDVIYYFFFPLKRI